MYSHLHTLPLNSAIKEFPYQPTWLEHGNCHVNHVPHWILRYQKDLLGSEIGSSVFIWGRGE